MPRDTTNKGAFQFSLLYDKLQACTIPKEHFVVQGHEVQTYLLANTGYRLWENILINFLNQDDELNKIRFDDQMNVGRVLIANMFG